MHEGGACACAFWLYVSVSVSVSVSVFVSVYVSVYVIHMRIGARVLHARV